ncbi:hypothetical protein SAY87_018698 [Trapa incisa]|uniref:YTH domain-containing family protein n=1 Tax=Trapa incisa TaxID=236973 RepID=A0AAN7Q0G0_9MYRT|nr:hypothetical protein SAY87_018698 [Trapa incisa]
MQRHCWRISHWMFNLKPMEMPEMTNKGLNLPRPLYLVLSAMSAGNGYVDRFYTNTFYGRYGGMVSHFPLKSHMVKDVPYRLINHIILENNENKLVTNSKYTQEVWKGKLMTRNKDITKCGT